MKRLTEEEFKNLKSCGLSAIRSNKFTVGKTYKVYPPKHLTDEEPIEARCSQDMPYVLTVDEPSK